MAVVHDQHTQINSPRGEVVLHQLSPTFFFRLGNLGKAITGQIHKIAGLVDGEIVDMDGLTGLIPYPGEILALQAISGRRVLGKSRGAAAEIRNSTF